MLKNKKTITVFGLSAFAIILVVVLMVVSQPAKQTDALNDTDTQASSVTPSEIDDTAPVAVTPEVKPSEIVKPDPTAEGNTNDIPLTVIEDKPEPPELPENVHETIPSTAEAGATANPAVNPDSTSKPAETTTPKDTTPKSGDKDGNGNVYIPGFGWVKDEGGGGQGSDSYVDESKLDNIIGH